MSEKSQQNLEKHALVINLGLGDSRLGKFGYHPTTYEMPDGSKFATEMAGFALWQWLVRTGRSPSWVMVPATAEAWKERGELLIQEARNQGLPGAEALEHVLITMPRSHDDLWDMVRGIEDWLADKAPGESVVLHLDLTHAFRAIPLAQLWVALYLQEAGRARIGVCGYGAYEKNRDTTPYLDLSHLLELAQWARAVRAFRERLDTAELAVLLRSQDRVRRRAAPDSGGRSEAAIRRVVGAAERAAPLFAAGLPLEVGIAVREALQDLTVDDLHEEVSAFFPVHRRLVEPLFESLQGLAVREVVRRDPKGSLALGPEELARQLHLIKLWNRFSMVSQALLGLRELIVSRVLWARGERDWLRVKKREAVEDLLGDLGKKRRRGEVSPARRPLASLWAELTDFRNKLAHAGMTRERVTLETIRARLQKLIENYEALAACDEPWILEESEARSFEGQGSEAGDATG